MRGLAIRAGPAIAQQWCQNIFSLWESHQANIWLVGVRGVSVSVRGNTAGHSELQPDKPAAQVWKQKNIPVLKGAAQAEASRSRRSFLPDEEFGKSRAGFQQRGKHVPKKPSSRDATDAAMWSSTHGYIVRRCAQEEPQTRFLLRRPGLQRVDKMLSEDIDAALESCKSFERVRATVEPALARLNAKALAAALYRIGLVEDGATEGKQLAHSVLSLLLLQIEHLTSRNAIAALHGLARINSQATAEQQLLLYHIARFGFEQAAEAKRGGSGAKPAAGPTSWAPANFLWACSTLKLRPSVDTLVAAVSVLRDAQLTAGHLSGSVHALGRLQFFPGHSALEQLVAKGVADAPIAKWDKPQHVANLAWGLNALQHSPSLSVCDALADHVCEHGSKYPAQAMISTLHCLGQSRVQLSKEGVARLAELVDRKAVGLDAKSSGVLESALSRLSLAARSST